MTKPVNSCQSGCLSSHESEWTPPKKKEKVGASWRLLPKGFGGSLFSINVGKCSIAFIVMQVVIKIGTKRKQH